MNHKQSETLPNEYKKIAWILVLGIMAPMLDSTMVNMGINQLASAFQKPLDAMQWVITAYILAMGAAIPFSSWLVEHYSGKLVYFWAEVTFGIASLFAGLAWNVDILIVFRIFQGFAASMLMPIMFTLLADLFGGNNMGKAMAIIGLPMTLGPMLGPIIGGVIIDLFSWRWMFLVNIPIMIVACYALYKYVPQVSPKNKNATFDFIGVILLLLASTLIVYGIVTTSHLGTFLNLSTLSWIGSGVIFSILYILYALKKTDAVLPLRLFSHRNYSGAMIINLLAGFVTTGPILLLPLYLQDVRHDPILIASLALIPQSIGMLVSRGLIGKMIDNIGAKWVVIVGTILTFLTTIPFAYVTATTNYLSIGIILFIRGIGGAAIKSAVQADTFVGIAKKESAASSLGSKLFEQLGNALGIAVVATVVSSYLASNKIVEKAQLLDAYHLGFFVTAGLGFLIILPSFMLTDRTKA